MTRRRLRDSNAQTGGTRQELDLRIQKRNRMISRDCGDSESLRLPVPSQQIRAIGPQTHGWPRCADEPAKQKAPTPRLEGRRQSDSVQSLASPAPKGRGTKRARGIMSP